ncbi:MAG: hypothetical protein Q9169_004891 [Polycauliona sp. 2 TL-2023]
MADCSCCNLCWGPDLSQLETGDHDWMYCSVPEAGQNSALHQIHEQPQIAADPWCEHPSPCRNPDSPLSQGDLDRFQRRTVALATNPGQSLDLKVDLLATLPGSESIPIQPPPPNPNPLLKLFQSLEKRLARLETSKNELVRSFDQDIEEIRDLLTEMTEAVIGVDVVSVGGSPICDEVFHDGDVLAELESPGTISQDLPPEAQQYIEAWHEGGLILVENLSPYTRTRDIHGLFGASGTITYLELHGADKSKPHVDLRYAYIHFAELQSAISAVEKHHGALLNGKQLMVFLLNTEPVRGEPGTPYLGSALEVLNFAGGRNYASPQADFRQDGNADLQKLLDHLDATAPLEQSAVAPSTYSLKPNLTARAPSLWRRTDTLGTDLETAPIAAKVRDVGIPQQATIAGPAETKPLLLGQPGAYVPPNMRKRKASTVAAGQLHPVIRVLKRGEPLPEAILRHGMIDHQTSKSALLAVEDFVSKGKQQLYTPHQAAAVDDDNDDEEGGVLL